MQGLETQHVASILEASGMASPEAAERARWGSGSPGLALADDALEVAKIATEALDAFSSGAAYADPMELSDALLAFANGAKSEGAQGKRDRIAKTIRLIVRALSDALAMRVGSASVKRSGADPALLERLAELPVGRIERAVELIVQVEEELSRNANTKFVLDGLVLDAGSVLAPVR
jgi:hypothetical protein